MKRWFWRLRRKVRRGRPDSAHHVKRTKLRRRLFHRRFIGSLLSIGLLLAIPITALFIRLSVAPLDLHFADDTIRPGLQRLLGNDAQADFSRLELQWVGSRLRFGIRDLVIKRMDGTLIASAPTTYIGLSVSSLLVGQVDPSLLEIREPTLALTLDSGGGLVIGGDADKTDTPERMPVVSLLDPNFLAKFAPFSQHLFGRGALSRLILDRVTVTVADQLVNEKRVYKPFVIEMEKVSSGAVAVEMSAPNERWSIGILLGPEKNGERAVTAQTKDFTLTSLIPEIQDVKLPPIPVRARVETKFSEAGLTKELNATLSIGKGEVQGPDFLLQFEPINLAAQLDASARFLVIAPTDFYIAGIRGQFKGQMSLPAAGDPTRPVRVDLRAENLTFGDANQKFAEVDRFNLVGAYEMANRTFWVDRATAGTEAKSAVELRGSVLFVGATPGLRLIGQGGNISLPAFKALWPAPTTPPVRKWVFENVEDGFVESGLVELAIPPGWLDGRSLLRDFVRGEFRLNNVKLKMAPSLPYVTGVSARVEATGNSARVEAQNGKLVMSSGEIQLPNALFDTGEISQKKPTGRLDMLALGSVSALIEMAQTQGFALTSSDVVDIKKLSGEGLANIVARVPLWKDAKLDEVTTTVEGEFKNVSAQAFVDGRNLDKGSFKINADGKTFLAEGQADIDAMPFRIHVKQDKGGVTQLKAETDATEDTRKKLGIDLTPWVTGVATLRFIQNFADPNDEEATAAQKTLELDLTKSRFSIPELKFEKNAGTAATLSFSPQLKNDKPIALDDLLLKGKNFTLRGRIKFKEDGKPHLIDFSEIRLREHDNFSARVELEGNNTTIQVTGRSLDASPFLSDVLSSSADDAPKGRRSLSIAVDQVFGAQGARLKNLRVKDVREAAQLTDFSLQANIGDGGTVSGEILSDQGRPYLFITSNIGGELVKFLDLYPRMQGGRLTLTQTLTDKTGRTADGVLFIENFNIANEPALGRLFGATPQIDEAQRARVDVVEFERLRIAFSRVPSALTVREGLLRNSTVGMTFKGLLDFRRNAIDLNGTFIPIYALNNLFARLPVIGALMGGQNEGLLGVTFAINGPLSGPILRVNPVSAIAPGFLRGLFQFRDAQAPSRQAPTDTFSDKPN